MARLGLVSVVARLGWALLVGASGVVCVCVNVRRCVRDREKMRVL